jgi:hypothetical protein
MISVLAYMIHLDLWMASTALALFLPQLVFVPLMPDLNSALEKVE